MKKLILLSLAILVTGATFFSACKKKDSPPDQVFTFNLATGTEYVSGNVTLTTGEQFKVGINATAATNAKLTRILVTRIFNNKPDVVFDTILDIASLNYNYFGIANSQAGDENWVFEVTQSTGETIERGFVITTEATVGPINTYDQRILGAQLSITGGAFASTDGMVYNLSDAKANASKIDWLYFFDFPGFATLAAPSDETAALIFNDPTNGLQTWGVKNATLFGKITDSVNWDAIQDDSMLITLSQGATESKSNELKAGDFVAFITAYGKNGLIRVNSIFQEEDGTIDISVKVQQ